MLEINSFNWSQRSLVFCYNYKKGDMEFYLPFYRKSKEVNQIFQTWKTFSLDNFKHRLKVYIQILEVLIFCYYTRQHIYDFPIKIWIFFKKNNFTIENKVLNHLIHLKYYIFPLLNSLLEQKTRFLRSSKFAISLPLNLKSSLK